MHVLYIKSVNDTKLLFVACFRLHGPTSDLDLLQTKVQKKVEHISLVHIFNREIYKLVLTLATPVLEDEQE